MFFSDRNLASWSSLSFPPCPGNQLRVTLLFNASSFNVILQNLIISFLWLFFLNDFMTDCESVDFNT